MKPLHIETPTWESRPLSKTLGHKVLMKMDALQPTGCFKIRGVGHACQTYCSKGAKSLVSSSGGNAGLAVVYSGQKLGVPAKVFVPQSTSPWMRRLIEREGGIVIEHGAAWDDAHAHAVKIAKDEGAAYIHPFDDPLIWEGHTSMIKEAARDGDKPEAVVLSVGGGGLLCGVLEGLHRVGWADVPVITVETEGAASFAKSVEAGRLMTLDAIRSIATTLGARTVTAEALSWTQRHTILPWVVSDRAALNACFRFLDDHRILVEPACGAALAAVYDRAEPLLQYKNVLVIVCGGAGVNLELFREWDTKLAG